MMTKLLTMLMATARQTRTTFLISIILLYRSTGKGGNGGNGGNGGKVWLWNGGNGGKPVGNGGKGGKPVGKGPGKSPTCPEAFTLMLLIIKCLI